MNDASSGSACHNQTCRLILMIFGRFRLATVTVSAHRFVNGMPSTDLWAVIPHLMVVLACTCMLCYRMCHAMVALRDGGGCNDIGNGVRRWAERAC